MRNREREVVVTGTGVCCHMGDDWASIESALREGRSTPFSTWAPAVEHDTMCQVVGTYPTDLTLVIVSDDALCYSVSVGFPPLELASKRL